VEQRSVTIEDEHLFTQQLPASGCAACEGWRGPTQGDKEWQVAVICASCAF